MRRLTIICDGGCDPNPGGFGTCAFIVYEGDVSGKRGAPRPRPLHSQRACIGHGDGMTNNVSEYRSVRAALKWAAAHAPDDEVEIRTDSQLTAWQISGQRQCSAEHLAALRDDCRALLLELPRVRVVWVPREETYVADALIKLTLSEARRSAHA